MTGKAEEPSSDGSGGKTKAKVTPKTSKKPASETETVDEEDVGDLDSTKEVMKTFLISVVNLVSGLTAGRKKAREKKKQDQNQELLQSLENLLG